MSTDKPWFKFYPTDWLTGDIVLLEPVHQAVFINLCALIWREGGTYKINHLTHKRINTDQQVLNTCVQVLTDVGILLNEDGILSVKFLNEQLGDIEETREKRSKAGKISAEKRKQSNKCQQYKKEERRKKKEDNREKKEDNKSKPQIHDDAIASIDFPSFFNDELKELFKSYADCRKADKKYMTEKAIQMHFKKLEGFSFTEVKTAYVDAIANGYQGVFPKKLPADQQEYVSTKTPEEQQAYYNRLMGIKK